MTLRFINIAIRALLGCLMATTALAKPGNNGNKTQRTAPLSVMNRLLTLKKAYQLGTEDKAEIWAQVTALAEAAKLTPAERASFLETQALMLVDARYPIAAAIYAAQALKTAPNAFANDRSPSWQILYRVSEMKPIHSVLEITGEQTGAGSHQVPVFGNDWNYYAANAAAKHANSKRAMQLYSSLHATDRHFLAAKYQEAMLLIESERLDDAEAALVAIVSDNGKSSTPNADPDRRRTLIDYARLALGRVYYERQKFPQAIAMYRGVSRGGRSFYDALFEQSWALFMGGYPAHALGALRGAESPFFKDVFNPEAPLLRAIVHYWLCRYDASRNALADFTELYEPQVKKLSEFLGRRRLDSETAYTLFENLIAGVSEESLGLPRAILSTAAEKDTMLTLRDQYAALLEESRNLEAKGIFGKTAKIARPLEYLNRWSSGLRSDIGKQFLAELQEMKKDFDRLHAQAEFLYVELLMSEKDQILGKELHASTKITSVSSKRDITGWGRKTQSWGDDSSGEYWWDEVGFYIQPVNSMCQKQ
ncbi:MAG: hypothetical protein FJ146_01490 [Deltaproteobacteria bacterium]|nr:hypothetical protein [Deltaproteobacteria bacterium]